YSGYNETVFRKWPPACFFTLSNCIFDERILGARCCEMKEISLILCGLIIVIVLADVAHAERRVVVNGVRLNIQAIRELEKIHCGPIPNGRYWINLKTGVWGYEGNPWPQGHIADNCYRRQKERRPSLSERGMLFSPYDFVR
ncbi:MAG: hypothetical protein ACE5F7_10015, partial [Nitrospiria bacterium]